MVVVVSFRTAAKRARAVKPAVAGASLTFAVRVRPPVSRKRQRIVAPRAAPSAMVAAGLSHAQVVRSLRRAAVAETRVFAASQSANLGLARASMPNVVQSRMVAEVLSTAEPAPRQTSAGAVALRTCVAHQSASRRPNRKCASQACAAHSRMVVVEVSTAAGARLRTLAAAVAHPVCVVHLPVPS